MKLASPLFRINRKTFLLALLPLLFLLTACSLPGSDLTNAPDNRNEENRNREFLRKLYSEVEGNYFLRVQSVVDAAISRCAKLSLGHKPVEVAKNNLGEPIYSEKFFAIYTDVDSNIIELELNGRYEGREKSNNLTLVLPEPPKNGSDGAAPSTNSTSSANKKQLSINGNISGGKIDARIVVSDFPSGNLIGKIATDSSCEGYYKDPDQFAKRIVDLFNGSWEGYAQDNSSSSGFMIKLSIFIEKIPAGSYFDFEINADYRRYPYENFVPTPLDFKINLTQNPISIQFSAKTESGGGNGNGPPKDPIRFNGFLNSKNEIEGTIRYPNGNRFKLILKKTEE